MSDTLDFIKEKMRPKEITALQFYFQDFLSLFGVVICDHADGIVIKRPDADSSTITNRFIFLSDDYVRGWAQEVALARDWESIETLYLRIDSFLISRPNFGKVLQEMAEAKSWLVMRSFLNYLQERGFLNG